MVQEAVAGEKAYAGALSSSMALVLEEFYRNITAVAVSAVTGRGMDELLGDDLARHRTLGALLMLS